MIPPRPAKIVVATSGGADSLFALYFLKKAGHEIIALHGLLAEMPDQERIGLLKRLEKACSQLAVPLVVEDLRSAFAHKIVEPFIDEYLAGRTPNPCAICNRQIKFGLLLEKAQTLGADFFATGHYASLVTNPYRNGLLAGKAKDAAKDQSYFLALLDKDQLNKLLFPNSEYRKTDILKSLAREGISIPAPGESQDICFAGGKWDNLISARLAEEKNGSNLSGNILLRREDGSHKIVGKHSGLWRYTRGQRKGLGICGPEPYHVLEKRLKSRELVIGPRKMLYMSGCMAKTPNYFVSPAMWPETVYVKTRFRQPFLAASMEAGANYLLARFEEKAFPSSEGQILAVYDQKGRMLAGAIIEEIF